MQSDCLTRSGLVLVIGSIALAGCGQSLTPNGSGGAGRTGKIEVPQSVGRFVIGAGEEKQGKAILPAARVNSSSSMVLSVDPADLTFEPEGAGGGSMQVSVAFGEVAGFGTACAEPVESFPSFTVTVNAGGQVTNISPPSMPVSDTVADLVSSGQFTICVTYSSSVAGTFDINAFTMN